MSKGSGGTRGSSPTAKQTTTEVRRAAREAQGQKFIPQSPATIVSNLINGRLSSKDINLPNLTSHSTSALQETQTRLRSALNDAQMESRRADNFLRINPTNRHVVDTAQRASDLVSKLNKADEALANALKIRQGLERRK